MCVFILYRQIFFTACWPNICKIRYGSLAAAAPSPTLFQWAGVPGVPSVLCPVLIATRGPSRSCVSPAFVHPAQSHPHLLQGIVWPQVLSGVVGNCVNGLANYILVSVLGLGVR